MEDRQEDGPGLERLNSEWLGGCAYRLWRPLLPTDYEWEEGVPRIYTSTDIHTLYRMADLERVVGKFLFEPEMPRQEQEEAIALLNTNLAKYHEALPFSGAERRWLAHQCANFLECPVAEEVFRSMQAELVIGGLWRVVQGGDLVRRWWSWRRQTDEYAHQDTVTVARTGLEAIARRFLPKPLPDALENPPSRT